MASGKSAPSMGALLRYSSVTVIIILDAKLGTEWNEGGPALVELAALLIVHRLDVDFRFRRHRRTRASPVAEWFDKSLLKFDESNCKC